MSQAPVTVDELRMAIRNVPDFPKPGIQFKDITPVLADGRLFGGCVGLLAGEFRRGDIDIVAGVDARGFIFAAALAARLETGFVPIRKLGKLPYRTLEQRYELEYGTNAIAIHEDAIQPGQRVMLVDDLLATGGTAAAAAKLLQRLGGRIVEVTFFVELGFLAGRGQLSGLPVRSLVTF